MKKKRTNKPDNIYPFSNEIKRSKYEFKKMIDEMPDEEFVDFMLLFFDFVDNFEDEDFEYFEDETDEKFDCLPF